MKKLIYVVGLVLMLSTQVHASETATPQEIFDMVLKGVQVMQGLGEGGLRAFNDPKGEFAWKDTYVQVYNCEAKKIVGHINPALLDWTSEKFDSIQDKKGNYITRLICEASNKPYGGWVEYWWPKAGETEPSRKITFVVQVPDSPYQVSAGIYDDTLSIEELNKISQ